MNFIQNIVYLYGLLLLQLSKAEKLSPILLEITQKSHYFYYLAIVQYI